MGIEIEPVKAGKAEAIGFGVGFIGGFGGWLAIKGEPISSAVNKVDDLNGQNDNIQQFAADAQNDANSGRITAQDASSVERVAKVETAKNNKEIKTVESGTPAEYHWGNLAQGGEFCGTMVAGAVLLAAGVYGVRRAKNAASEAIQQFNLRRSLPHGNGWN